MRHKIKIAGIQIQPSDDLDKNLSRAGGLIGLAADEGASIAALPQLFNTRWFPSAIDRRHFSLAEEEDGRTVTFLKGLAADKKMVLVASIFEKSADAHFNTAFVIGADGEVIGKYRKMHVPQIPLWEEKAYFKPGDLGFPVFKTPVADIGVQLCWDSFFPEGFRLLALKGAQIIFVPTASAFFHSRMKWERALSAAAHSNGVFIFRANRVGGEEKQEFYGRSFCLGPDGEFVTKPSGSSEGVVVSEIDLSEIGRVRGEWVFMNDRRPEHYGEIAEKMK